MRHKYISSTNFEYYWFGSIHIVIQVAETFMNMDDFAVIRTEQSAISKREFEYFKEKDLLLEVTEADFKQALERALGIINKCVVNFKIKD